MSALDHTQLRTLLKRAEQIVRDVMGKARLARVETTITKSHQDFVTNIDHAADKHLEEALGALLPDCPILSEERAVVHRGKLERYWIVDPIDGTLNMMAGLPFYAVAVCLVDQDGPLISVVGAVAQDEIYTAIRGAGAKKNGLALKLDETVPPPALIVPSTGLLDKIMSSHPAAYDALRKAGKIRNLGSQALHLARVAEGSFAAVASIEAKIWDEAASGLILLEAGGVWRSAADQADWSCPALLMEVEQQNSVSAHPLVADQIASALNKVF
ncbi:inositol monophosphatase [Tateyamaria sp.]|jgi:myo-inositol-1(or 4)-monophosphatase|nr:inositol monophosphatase [Tateyamaria sp.]